MDYGFVDKGPVLTNLQANILHPHNCPVQWFLFFQLNETANKKSLGAALFDWAIQSELGPSSAQDQYSRPLEKASILTNAFFSSHGIRQIVEGDLNHWEDLEFQAGMKDPFIRAKLQDDALDNWEQNYQQDCDLLVGIAGPSNEQLESRAQQLEIFFQQYDIGILLFIEKGAHLYKEGNEVEPFGFRDNLSQPLLWKKNGQLMQENLPLVFDRNWGSYLVFRKLEQDVAAFDTEVKRLADYLGISIELAEAQIMGRFKDGTPLVLFDRPVMEMGTAEEKEQVKKFNLFDRDNSSSLGYNTDPHGVKCPFHAHIRKANPRAIEKINDPRYIDYF